MRSCTVKYRYLFVLLFVGLACEAQNPRLVPITEGWSKNSINATIFRKNSVVSHNGLQYVAFYNEEGTMMLAKRKLGSKNWDITKTPYSGNVKDAHNGISLMIDGDGYLHVSWDHHGTKLRYAKGNAPESTELTKELSMVGEDENDVTYPEFYRLKDGNLLFMYRSGVSGRGNLVINKYDTGSQSWSRLQDVLIDGENERNAYWQSYVDVSGTIHISWVWRETFDVATNHDISYARSKDGGVTWEKSNGEEYQLPITQESAEIAMEILQGSELINQTSMYADKHGTPYIATYWKDPVDLAPGYKLVFKNGSDWKVSNVKKRVTDFSLNGIGTKKIPISRPLIFSKGDTAFVVYRDAEQGNRVTISYSDINNLDWKSENLTEFSVDSWEPGFDSQLWEENKKLHLYVQRVGQGDQEDLEDMAPQMVYILEWDI